MQASILSPITTFSVIRFSGIAQWWALKQMGILPAQLTKVKGLSFCKLMGSGKGPAFSLMPDFSRYVLLAVWNSLEAAEAFMHASQIMHTIKSKAEEVWTIKLLPIRTQGRWDGVNPFTGPVAHINEEGPIAVLTRATVKWHKVISFCQHAIPASTAVATASGLLFSCGVGELPLIRQATFSVWENMEAMKAFAYKTDHHKAVIKGKQIKDWYSEELFARFQLLGTEGTYLGTDPLQAHLLKPVGWPDEFSKINPSSSKIL